MKKLGILVVVLLLSLVACQKEEVGEEKKKEQEERIHYVKEVTYNKEINIGVYGDHLFESKGDITVNGINLTDDLIDYDFILLPEKDYSEEEKNQIQEKIDEGFIFFIYGDDVSFIGAKSLFQFEAHPFEVDSNVNMNYVLVGYGYVQKHKKKMPIFLGTNVNDETDLQKKIYDFLTTQRSKEAL